jgi:hypothetical protein
MREAQVGKNQRPFLAVSPPLRYKVSGATTAENCGG